MVDVGYFINHKHGVIRNVMPISNTKTEHLCFVSCLPNANGEEQYALKKEDIEYVIPSNCVSGKIVFDKDGVTEYGADGSVVMKGKYIENDESKFDYNVVYTIDGVMRYHSVPKSKLADVIEDAFANGGYGMSIGCVERENDNT